MQFREVNRDVTRSFLQALASRQVDMIAGNSTDGRIGVSIWFNSKTTGTIFRLTKECFSRQHDGLQRVPALGEVLQKLGGAITTDEMRESQLPGADGLRRDKKNVVREWLLKKGTC